MLLDRGIFYTVEELADQAGLSVKTIQNLKTLGIVPPAIRGIVPNQPSKGVYPVETIELLRQMNELKRQGKTMKEIAAEFDRRRLGCQASSM